MPRAVVCRELGPPERLRLESFASAQLAPGQVRVAVHAAGINFPDILMAAGEYQLKPELPFTPGVEAAGEVTEIADGVAGVAVGDRVIVRMRHGAYVDEALVAPAQLMPLPSTFDYAEGATFLAAHGTAHHALVDRGELQPGEVLLVHGAGGGVGLAAVEIGKMLGATVIAAASSEEKLGVARARGADHLVLTMREPFRDAVKRITDGRGADVVFDPVGGEIFEHSQHCIA
jgi:NADPH2:quinone reductase